MPRGCLYLFIMLMPHRFTVCLLYVELSCKGVVRRETSTRSDKFPERSLRPVVPKHLHRYLPVVREGHGTPQLEETKVTFSEPNVDSDTATAMVMTVLSAVCGFFTHI